MSAKVVNIVFLYGALEGEGKTLQLQGFLTVDYATSRYNLGYTLVCGLENVYSGQSRDRELLGDATCFVVSDGKLSLTYEGEAPSVLKTMLYEEPAVQVPSVSNPPEIMTFPAKRYTGTSGPVTATRR